MSTPSLLNIPYLYKAGTLYSQIPESGAGDFTVSRTTTVANRSTRINKDGFIETVLDNVPRLDYPLGGAVNGCPALLVEPSAQNLVPSGTTYAALAGTLASTVTDSPAVAISGTLCTKNEASGTLRYISQLFSAVALSSGTTYSVSRFFKYNGVAFNTTLEANVVGQWGNVSWKQVIVLSAASGVTLGASTSCTGSVENFGNGWYRVNVRVTTGGTISGGANVAVLSELPAALSTGQGFLTACPQLEVGSVATSYIPTTTAAVTRSAETISKTGISSLIGQTEGTIYLEVDAANASSQFFRINIGVTNAIHIYKNSSGRYGVAIYTSTSSIFLTDTSAKSGFVKIAIAYKSGESALVINGGSPITSATAYSFSAALDTINFLGGVEPARPALIRAVELYPNRLTNAQLATLTAP